MPQLQCPEGFTWRYSTDVFEAHVQMAQPMWCSCLPETPWRSFCRHHLLRPQASNPHCVAVDSSQARRPTRGFCAAHHDDSTWLTILHAPPSHGSQPSHYCHSFSCKPDMWDVLQRPPQQNPRQCFLEWRPPPTRLPPPSHRQCPLASSQQGAQSRQQQGKVGIFGSCSGLAGLCLNCNPLIALVKRSIGLTSSSCCSVRQSVHDIEIHRGGCCNLT